MLWEQASQASEKSEHGEALLWYNYSLSLFPADAEQDKNIAKLQVCVAHPVTYYSVCVCLCKEGFTWNCFDPFPTQRNRCSCYLHIGEHEKASEAIEAAKAQDPDSSQTHFLIFKLSLLLGQQEKG